MRRGLARWLAVALLLAGAASAAHAEAGWSTGAPLLMRSGPSTQNRILGALQPGQQVEILQRGEGWIRVRTDDGKEGWVADGYLQDQPPPLERVQTLEAETTRLREELETLRERAERLAEENTSLSTDDASRRERLEELTQENMRLRAGERWAEWLTGALILGTGMALGGILARVSGRRSRNRLKL